MAGYGILNDLVGEIRALTESELSKQVSNEIREYTKGRKISAEDIAKYENTLRTKYNKQNDASRKAIEKKRLDDEAKYAEKIEDRIAAKKRLLSMQLREMESQEVEHRDQLREDKKTLQLKNRLALQDAADKQSAAALEKASNALVNNVNTIKNTVGAGALLSTATKGVNDYIGSFSKYFTEIEVGLLGTGRGFNSAKLLIDNVIGLNPIVKQTEVLENLQSYIEKGILRDAELRATIATIGTKISNTFNSLDPTLLSMTKILQEDTTVERLAMEAALTRYMASSYEDTSYFAKDTNADVSAQLLQALSQMGAAEGLALEYSVQKWLGSFVSVGVSEETAKKIAEGIGYLTSGNISGLTGDSALMNLMLAAANRGNVDISSVLQNGANANTIDNLMKGLYDQVSEIAKSGNQVVKSQYAELYGMSIRDISALMNLTAEAVNANLTSNMSAGAMSEFTRSEIKEAINRVSTSTLIDNSISNVMSILGEKIASNPVMNIMWKMADMVTQSGGITLPGVMALGTGLAQLPDVDQLLKAGLLTGSVIGSVADMLASLEKAGGFDFSKFKDADKISSMTSAEQATVGNLSAEVATVANTGATYIGDTTESNLLKSSMAQIQDLITLTGQDQTEEETPATSSDIDRLIAAIEEEGRKNRGEYAIQNNGPLSTVRWG